MKSESREGLASFLQVQVDSGPAGEAAASARSLTAPEAETAAGTQVQPGQRRRLSAGVSVGLPAVRFKLASAGVAGNGPDDKPAA